MASQRCDSPASVHAGRGLKGPVKLKLPAFGCGSLALLVSVQATVLQLRGLLGHDEHPILAARHLFIWGMEAVPSTGVGVPRSWRRDHARGRRETHQTGEG